jgi:hypothetical protein
MPLCATLVLVGDYAVRCSGSVTLRSSRTPECCLDGWHSGAPEAFGPVRLTLMVHPASSTAALTSGAGSCTCMSLSSVHEQCHQRSVQGGVYLLYLHSFAFKYRCILYSVALSLDVVVQ